jgi:hypothetical protein
MGELAQTEAQSLAEMLAAPASASTYVPLVFVGMAKANEGIYLARDGNLFDAKRAVYYSEKDGGGYGSAAWINIYADKMLRDLHAQGEISDQLFDQLFNTFQNPLSDAVGEASVAIIRGKDAILRTIDWLKSFFVTFETGVQVFFQQQAAKITNLYTGLDNRITTLTAFIDSIKRNKPYVPITAQKLPVLEQMLAGLKESQAGIAKMSAEAELTPKMLRGEEALGQAGLLVKTAARAAKLGLLAREIPWTKTARWLTGPLMKLGMSKLTARGASKVLWYITIGVPKFVYSSLVHNPVVTVALFYYGTKYLEKKHPDIFEDSPKKDLHVAEGTGDKTAEKSAADVLREGLAGKAAADKAIKSLRRDFASEAALVDQYEGGDDTTWVLYALGGGALALGLYLYFQNKNKNV